MLLYIFPKLIYYDNYLVNILCILIYKTLCKISVKLYKLLIIHFDY